MTLFTCLSTWLCKVGEGFLCHFYTNALQCFAQRTVWSVAGCRCAEGLTAGDYARQAGHDVIAAYFDRGCVSEDEDDGGEGEDDGGGPIIEGESASQRRCGGGVWC